MKTLSIKEWLFKYYNNKIPPYLNQITFIRDNLSIVFTTDWDKWNGMVSIINNHKSRSCLLPVYQITTPELIIEARNNFFDWKISVESTKDIYIPYEGLFNPDAKWEKYFCEGVERIYPSYKENKRKFTIETYTNYQMYTICYLIAQHHKHTII